MLLFRSQTGIGLLERHARALPRGCLEPGRPPLHSALLEIGQVLLKEALQMAVEYAPDIMGGRSVMAKRGTVRRRCSLQAPMHSVHAIEATPERLARRAVRRRPRCEPLPSLPRVMAPMFYSLRSRAPSSPASNHDQYPCIQLVARAGESASRCPEWWPKSNHEVEVGALEFDCRLERNVYQRLGEVVPVTVWLKVPKQRLLAGQGVVLCSRKTLVAHCGRMHRLTDASDVRHN
jgi:hypothetical protein